MKKNSHTAKKNTHLVAPSLLHNQATLPAQDLTLPADTKGIEDAQKSAAQILFQPEKDQPAEPPKSAKNIDSPKTEDVSESDDTTNNHKIDLMLPDDFEVDAQMMDGFQSLVQKLDLSKETAQELLDFAVASQEAGDQNTTKTSADDQHKKQLLEAVYNDVEFGGAGFDHSIQIAQNALHSVADEPLMALLDESGLGDHPEMIRLFYRIGKQLSEDTIVHGQNAGAGRKKSTADILFGTS